MLTGRSPWVPLVGLVTASAVFLILGFGLGESPTGYLGLVLLLPGTGLAFLAVLVAADSFYLRRSSEPSLFERLRVRRCPYCGAWAVHATRMDLTEREVGTTIWSMGATASDGVVGTRAPGADRPASQSASLAVMNLSYQERLRCSKCGKQWSRTVVHHEVPPNAVWAGGGAVSGGFSTELSERGDPQD